MKRFALLPILLILFSPITLAYKYAFDLIPDNLKYRADAVIRTEEMSFEIFDIGKATLKFKTAITLLNDDATFYRFASIYYDKFNKIKHITASVYDEKGKLVKVIKSNEIIDMSAVEGGEFYSDDRRKVILFPKMRYPYTIEYEYETSIKSLINYPTWDFQNNPDVSVEKSGVQYIIPKNLKVRFKEVNINSKVDSTTIKDKLILTWQEENLPTVKANPYGIPFTYTSAKLLSAPNNFKYGGYSGSMESWEKFGEWNEKIIKDRDNLSQEEIEKVQNIVKEISNERDRIKAIYNYMQSKTRYVSISLGIGGFQPFDAKYVSENGFGDCKALTNYTMALLNAVGIKSYYTLVKSGSDENITPDFVSNQFDHIILCVPQPHDTVWLECTSQTLPFNYLSDFTSNRYVLLTTETGGKLVKTPDFKDGVNSLKLKGTINVENIENISTADFTKEYSGKYYGFSQQTYEQDSEDEIKRYLNKELPFSTFNITKISFTETKSENPTATLNYNVDIRDFSTKNSNKLFFTPCLSKMDYLESDTFNIQISNSTFNSDSLIYRIPINYEIEYLPNELSLETIFGKYYYNIISENDKLIFIRRFELKKGQYTKAKFDEFYQFINTIANKDREKIILKKS